MEKKKISNIDELNSYLLQQFGNRISTIVENILGMGEISGQLDGCTFVISFCADTFLLISTDKEKEEILDLMCPILKSAMNDAEPICRYDMKLITTTNRIEWDLENPEKRISDIINGDAFKNNEKISSIVLYNGKRVEDYLVQKEADPNEKIYGIYPGVLDGPENREKLENMSEADLYLSIEGLGGYIWRCQHEIFHGRMKPFDLTEYQYALEYLVYQTTRFGVEIPEPKSGKHVEKTESYNSWYNFYHNHFDSLSNVEWREMEELRKSGADYSKYLPEHSWKESNTK